MTQARITEMVVVLFVLCLVTTCAKARWDDCRKVGHTAFYCVMDQ